MFYSVTEDREVVTAEDRALEEQNEEPNGGIGQELEGETRMPRFGSEDYNKFVGRAINATIVLGFGTYAITNFLTIDHDYWQVS